MRTKCFETLNRIGEACRVQDNHSWQMEPLMSGLSCKDRIAIRIAPKALSSIG